MLSQRNFNSFVSVEFEFRTALSNYYNGCQRPACRHWKAEYSIMPFFSVKKNNSKVTKRGLDNEPYYHCLGQTVDQAIVFFFWAI